jgi:two-component system, cell cycle sensor histidine kinase and response regulator CckA
MGYSDLALMKVEPNSPIAEYLSHIQHASERAADLCSQMLAYSGRGKFVVTSCHLSDLVEEIVHLLRVVIRKEVVLDLLLSKQIPSVKIDLSQIRQVIMNLVINASESMEQNGGLLTIKTGLITAKKNEIKGNYRQKFLSEGDYICLEVTDTGEGMNEKIRKKIFDPFYTTKFAGRGLGLAAVLGIVRGHNGIIQVLSEQGKGSTFKVYLPVENSEDEPDQNDEITRLAENSQATSPGLILVVDDEEENRSVFSKMLNSAGYEVILASDGLQALKIFNKEHSGIQAVLLDLTLPQMSGNQVFKEMKKINPNTRIVLTSGFDEQEVSNLFNETDFAGFIQKPFTTSNLINEFNKILE